MWAALDTNVLAYAEGLGDERRCTVARSLVERMPAGRVLLPAQTLGELYRVLTGKAGWGTDPARAALLSWADSFEVADSTWPAFQGALDIAVDHGLQIWDALILSVAADNRCRPPAQRRPAQRLHLARRHRREPLLGHTILAAGGVPGRCLKAHP